MSVYGTRLFGKVDEVPGVCHVATKFGHINFIPLLPLGSHIVVDEFDKGWNGVPCWISLKSILMAWIRCLSMYCFLILVVVAYFMFHDGKPWKDHALIAVAGLAVFIISKTPLFQRASFRKACKLADKLMLPPIYNNEIRAIYGKEPLPVEDYFAPPPVSPPVPVVPIVISGVKEWHYILDGQTLGPVGRAEILAMLKKGELKPNDNVWKKDFGSEWKAINSVPDLSAG